MEGGVFSPSQSDLPLQSQRTHSKLVFMEQNQCQNLKLLFSWIVWGRISVKILFCMVFSHGLFARSFLMVFSIVFADFSWSLYGIWSLATPIRQGRPFIT